MRKHAPKLAFIFINDIKWHLPLKDNANLDQSTEGVCGQRIPDTPLTLEPVCILIYIGDPLLYFNYVDLILSELINIFRTLQLDFHI